MEEWQKIIFNGMEAFVTKIDSTHFKMTFDKSKQRFTVYHVAQLKDPKNNTFYESLVDWLHGNLSIEGRAF